jgi:hypothetical protein
VSATSALSLTTLSPKDTNASTTSSPKTTRPVSLRGLSSQFESTPIAMPMNTKAIPSVVYTATVCPRARRRRPGDTAAASSPRGQVLQRIPLRVNDVGSTSGPW